MRSFPFIFIPLDIPIPCSPRSHPDSLHTHPYSLHSYPNFLTQFNYAPLIWMFCHKGTYLKMQKIHHKSLKVIYQFDASYDDLLQLSNSVSLHQRHLRFLLTEIYKSTGTLNPSSCGHTSNTERFHIA